MGLYERDYVYDPQPGVQLRLPRTMALRLVLVTVVVYLAQLAVGTPFSSALSLSCDWWRQPWQVYQLLTYGFLHSPESVQHIAWNMFGLWMFGRSVEERYGGRELLGFYLSAIVFSGLLWTLAEAAQGEFAHMLGASGGVTAVVILFALTYPHRTIYLNFFIPVPAWLLGCLVVLGDMWGSLGGSDPMRGGNVAFSAHLAGALYALVYFRYRWNPFERVAGLISRLGKPRRPKLRVLQPDTEVSTDDEVDRILRKINEHGQDSLTGKERRTLEKASREYQQRREP
jgi:membrane associated rhomboid family serine protease